MLFPFILMYSKEKKLTFFYNNLGIRAVIIYFALCKKLFKINLQLNFYPYNTFHNN